MKPYPHSLLKEEEDPIAIQYLDYIKNGFPERNGKKKDVLIVYCRVCCWFSEG